MVSHRAVARHANTESQMSQMKLLPDANVRKRYGGVPVMTIHRWDNTPEMNFPKPVWIRNRKYRNVDELDAFDERMRLNPQRRPRPGDRSA